MPLHEQEQWLERDEAKSVGDSSAAKPPVTERADTSWRCGAPVPSHLERVHVVQQSFAQAPQNEFGDTGVTITSLMAGPTETDFFHRADVDDRALMNGEPKIVAGSLRTKASGPANDVLPDAAKAQLHRVMVEPGSADR